MIRKYINLATIHKESAIMEILPNGSATLLMFKDGCIKVNKTYKKESTARAVLTKDPGMWVRYTMPDHEAVRMNGHIFNFVRDYSTFKFTLKQVYDDLFHALVMDGYDVEHVDTEHRDYKILRVDGCQYKLWRKKGWSQYQVTQLSLIHI